LVPIRDVAAVTLKAGPSMLRNENGMLAAVAATVKLPTGTSLLWSGY
jgi:Cu/Ag efflux pump CusA